MNAMEKVAWTELLISTAALLLALALIPWLGNGAIGVFGLLGFMVCGTLFLRSKNARVVVDERDRAIDARARWVGVTVAWMATFMTLVAIVLWSGYYNDGVVRVHLLNWLIWCQFALCYGVKGLVGVVGYRRQRLAA